eukprot:TRINITY_DN10101_c0_g1_i1.p2 TRINITY_DN10101_c0_g1~~TRINITY_DN10101_c0_g1_i1.p2  ORF type:complete len:189 (+),score=67.73 TRINITY_DN10101_c0_g1_i1:1-567(+)
MGGAPSFLFEGLYQGGDDVLENRMWFEDNGITHTLTVCFDRPLEEFESFLQVTQIALDDVPSSDLLPHLTDAALLIHKVRMQRKKEGKGCIYVHCNAGISRSSTCTLAYLMAWFDLDFFAALKLLRKGRKAAHPNSGFQAQLKRYYESDNGFKKVRAAMLSTPGYEELLKDDLVRKQELLSVMDPDGF